MKTNEPIPTLALDDLLSMAASAIEDLLEHTDPNTSYYSGVWADVPGKLRAAAMLQAGNSPVIPDGYVMVPMRLTAENGAKAALLGEFNLEYSLTCHECFGEGCDDCSGEGTWTNTIPIDWTTIKEIWAKGVEHFAAAPQEVQIVSEKIEQYRKKNDRCDVCAEGARGGCGTCAFNGNL